MVERTDIGALVRRYLITIEKHLKLDDIKRLERYNAQLIISQEILFL